MAEAADILDFIAGRRSVKAALLADPAPNDTELGTLLQSCMSAPDHGAIRPWRFKVIRGDSRHRLSDVFEAALKARDPSADEEAIAKIRSKPLRSPLIVAVVAEIMPNHPKVPPWEQVVATSCATQNLLLAVQAAGWGAVLLTGWPAEDATVKQALGFQEKDQIVGFVYMGTPSETPREMTRPVAADYISAWTG